VVIGLLGGGLGLALSQLVAVILPFLPVIGAIVSAFPASGLPPRVAALGLGVSLLIAVGAGFVPAMVAYRARITEMLRQV
jgi:ABC-type antimicrobial peptide transport system permease subunit